MMPEQDHNIRFVAPEDKSFWLSIDKHLSEAEFDKKVRDKQGYVLLMQDRGRSLWRTL